MTKLGASGHGRADVARIQSLDVNNSPTYPQFKPNVWIALPHLPNNAQLVMRFLRLSNILQASAALDFPTPLFYN